MVGESNPSTSTLTSPPSSSREARGGGFVSSFGDDDGVNNTDETPTTTSASSAPTLDAHALDEYLLRLLFAQLFSSSSSSSSSSSATDDNSDSTPVSLLSMMMKKKNNDYVTIWMLPLMKIINLLATKGQTPAVRLLGLEFAPAIDDEKQQQQQRRRRRIINTSSDNNYTQLRLVSYAVLSIVIPAMYQCFLVWDEKRKQQQQQQQQSEEEQEQEGVGDHDGSSGGGANSSRTRKMIRAKRRARQRQEMLARWLKWIADSALPTARLVLLLHCWSGRLSNPSLPMFLTGYEYRRRKQQKQQTASSAIHHHPRSLQLFVEFAHRRWLFQETVRTVRCLFAGLPLVPGTLIKPFLDSLKTTATNYRYMLCRSYNKNNISWLSSSKSSSPQEGGEGAEDSSLQQQQEQPCPYCLMCPIRVPVETNCHHYYCYTCLYSKSLQQSQRNQRSSTASNSDVATTIYCRLCRERIHHARRV